MYTNSKSNIQFTLFWQIISHKLDLANITDLYLKILENLLNFFCKLPKSFTLKQFKPVLIWLLISCYYIIPGKMTKMILHNFFRFYTMLIYSNKTFLFSTTIKRSDSTDKNNISDFDFCWLQCEFKDSWTKGRFLSKAFQ